MFRDAIVGKNFENSLKKLYYEKAQHLVFFLKRRIKYEETIQKKIRTYIKRGDLVFDIGGNIGQYAIPLSEMVSDTGRVITFEPDFKNFAFLQFNASINKCENVTCINSGVGSEDTVLEFYRDTETGGRRGSFRKEYVGDTFKGYSEKGTLRSLDSLIAEFGEPDFIKIDVEGFETEVISGLSIDLTKTLFLIEVREETKAAVFEYFSHSDYECVWIDEVDTVITSAAQIPGFANLLFKKRQK